MLSTLQIVLLSVSGAAALLTLTFFVMFVVEISVEHKEKKEPEVSSIYSTENYIINVKPEEKEVSVDEMLATLEEKTKGEEVSITEDIIENKKEEVVEEKVEKEEKVEVRIEDLAVIDEDDSKETSTEEDVEIMNDIAELKAATHEPITAGSVIDYKARLAKIIENRDKIERDLTKIQKSILKYERTKRRKNRNQKMLDRRAGELTNLNLVMYSVTDIKNVDEDKKVKQEELTAHIAELKASIQDAEEFIESNKEKNEHNVKMAKFLIQERTRYNEEIAELQNLINKADDTAVSA